MNSDQIAGQWKQLKGSAKQQWGKLTDDDLDVINGQRESLVGKLQERYGIAKEEAQKKADDWLKTIPSQHNASDNRNMGEKPRSFQQDNAERQGPMSQQDQQRPGQTAGSGKR